jgi:L-alanine-DL-glutamate epimerase-like enolase superfamily enzyme
VQLTRRLDRPRNSREERSERTFTFVVVETDARTDRPRRRLRRQALMPTIIERRLRPMAVRLNPCDIDAVWQRLFASRAFWETGGSVLCGISAIEVACWDIRGQAEGVSVCDLRRRAATVDRGVRQRPALGDAAHGRAAARFVERGFAASRPTSAPQANGTATSGAWKPSAVPSGRTWAS